MNLKQMALTVVVGAAYLHASIGVAQNQEETRGLDQFVDRGPALNRLCPQAVPKSLSADKIAFEKVLEIEPLTPGFALLEGPLWVGGRLLMSHIGGSVGDAPNPADLVALRDGKLEVLRSGYGSNGLAIDPTGAVIAARHADGTITRLSDGKVIAEGYKGARFNSPNDLVMSERGDLYITDPDWQAPKPHPQPAERAYHIAPSGKVTPFGKGINKPNGVMLTLDQKVLYLGGTNGLYRFEIQDKGQVVDKAQRVQPDAISGGVDGMSLDCAGNLFVTGDGKIHVLKSGSDQLIASYEVPGVTNVAFGGEDAKTVYATTLGEKPQVWKAESNIPGLPF